jgi:hypothetical protein
MKSNYRLILLLNCAGGFGPLPTLGIATPYPRKLCMEFENIMTEQLYKKIEIKLNFKKFEKFQKFQ